MSLLPTALITGAGRGFGRELVHVFAHSGWTVFPLVRDPVAADELATRWGATCHPIVADVASEDVEKRIAGVLGDHSPSLDLLVNNAGQVRKLRWLVNTTPADLEDLFRVHCVGAFRCVRAALPFLRRAPAPLVVNITSRWGSIGRTVAGEFRGIYSYQIAKCAQNMLTACLDHELRASGIPVVAVHPGKLMTEVAAADADTSPRDAATRFADWVQSLDRTAPCGCYDLMGGGLIEW
jgi:NAD(P)-dependent dehydrogenase (short-subunit alcohol dehydrogenase family)